MSYPGHRQIFPGHPRVRNRLHILLVVLCLLPSFSLSAQNRVVYGKLTAFNTYPVVNVKVSAKKAKTSAISDSTGFFAIVCNPKDVIRIRPDAFQPVNRRVTQDMDTLKINLIFVDNKKNRELAIGYGYMKREDLMYAVDHLEQENNEFCNYTNVYDIFKGRFPGVTVENNAVYVRGQTSINSDNKAVFVVDGVTMDDISWIHPCEIKSINVLKDNAAAIYGIRGSNGVIIIETKKAD